MAVGATHISVIDATLTGSNNAILRNEIYGNVANPDLSITTSEGIDLLRADLESEELVPPYLPDTFYDTGLNPNTVGGNITGQGNDYINHAIITTASHSGQNVSVVFSLNAAGSPGGKYRVEFFANDAPDREGRYYLGYVDVENGSGISVSSLVAQDGLDMSGKYITATVTPFDESLPNNGFGGTSEFSESVLVNTISSQEANSGSLAGTGSNSTVIIYVAAIMSILAIGLLVKSRFIDK